MNAESFLKKRFGLIDSKTFSFQELIFLLEDYQKELEEILPPQTFDFSTLPKDIKQEHWDKFRMSREKILVDQNIMRWGTDLNLTKDQIILGINTYFKECVSKEDIYRNFLDYKSHCYNWIRKNKTQFKYSL